MNKISRDLKANASKNNLGPVTRRQVAGAYTKKKYGNVLYGKEKR
jgi:hypothetical protein